MKLEDAIKHAEEVAESKRRQAENGEWENGSMTERDCLECAEEHKQLAEWLKELKQLRDQTRWIPVSERLPRRGEYGKVLVTYIPSGGILFKTVIIAYYSDLMGITKPIFHIGDVGKESFRNITKQVTAWMPSPEPYKAESEEE